MSSEKSLNSQSGLKGICGLNDMREVIDQAGKETIVQSWRSMCSATASRNT